MIVVRYTLVTANISWKYTSWVLLEWSQQGDFVKYAHGKPCIREIIKKGTPKMFLLDYALSFLDLAGCFAVNPQG